MARKKDFGAMEQARASGNGAARAREALRTRLATPPRSLPLDQLQPNPLNPRGGEPDEGLDELAETMRQHGQLQQAQVIAREDFLEAFPDTAEQLTDAPWVVFIGNRRLAAARLAGLDMLDVRAPEGVAIPEEIESRVLIENLQRSDLPLLKEAEFLQRQLNREGQTLRSVGAAIGKSFAYVQQRVALLKLIPELQDLLHRGELNFKTARSLYALSAEEQTAVFRAGPPWSPPAARSKADATQSRNSDAPPATPPDVSDEAPADEPGAEAEPGQPSEVPTTAPTNDDADQDRRDSEPSPASTPSTAVAETTGKDLVAPLAGAVSSVLDEIRQAEASSSDGDVVGALREAARHVESALTTLRRL